MDDKQKVLQTVIPLAVLEALTPEAIEAIPPTYLLGENLVAVYRFPFRIGRESRLKRVEGELYRDIRPKRNNGVVPNNDLYLADPYLKINIGREHLQIEQHENVYMAVDRGSPTGTRLIHNENGNTETGSSFIIKDGDILCLGEDGSPFLYKFHILENVKFTVAD